MVYAIENSWLNRHRMLIFKVLFEIISCQLSTRSNSAISNHLKIGQIIRAICSGVVFDSINLFWRSSRQFVHPYKLWSIFSVVCFKFLLLISRGSQLLMLSHVILVL